MLAALWVKMADTSKLFLAPARVFVYVTVLVEN